MSWIGGKKALREKILERFPSEYTKYIEVFGGAGWVLFGKPFGKDDEYFNDMNQNLANLYLCIQNKTLCRQLKAALTTTINCEKLFKVMTQTNLLPLAEMPDVNRAAQYYQLIRYSYGSSCSSFGGQPVDLMSSLPVIDAASQRLRRVVIYNRDFDDIIQLRDSPDSFFYCDPPYFGTEQYYQNVNFGCDDHERLARTLLSIQGKFLLSYNDCSEIRALYNHSGILIERVERLNNLRQQVESGCMYSELLISNYMPSKHSPAEQLRLEV